MLEHLQLFTSEVDGVTFVNATFDLDPSALGGSFRTAYYARLAVNKPDYAVLPDGSVSVTTHMGERPLYNHLRPDGERCCYDHDPLWFYNQLELHVCRPPLHRAPLPEGWDIIPGHPYKLQRDPETWILPGLDGDDNLIFQTPGDKVHHTLQGALDHVTRQPEPINKFLVELQDLCDKHQATIRVLPGDVTTVAVSFNNDGWCVNARHRTEPFDLVKELSK